MNEKMVITKIEKQKKSKNRFNVYINEEYAFAIHEDVFIANRIHKDMVVDNREIENILYEEEKNKVWNKSLKYISHRPRTIHEVSNYLKNLEYDFEIINTTIERLKKNEYLNDKLYAKQFIEQRILSNPKGKKYISYELKNKGINQVDIDEAIENIDEEIEFNMAMKVSIKKVEKINNLEWNEKKAKLGNYLKSKGFSYEVIYKIFDHFQNEFEKNN